MDHEKESEIKNGVKEQECTEERYHKVERKGKEYNL